MLAHLIIKVGDNLYEDNPGWLVTLAVVGALFSLVVWQRKGIVGWLGRHKRSVAFSAFAVLILISALTVIAVSNEHKEEARHTFIPIK